LDRPIKVLLKFCGKFRSRQQPRGSGETVTSRWTPPGSEVFVGLWI